MPDFIRAASQEHDLLDAYFPVRSINNYIGWIQHTKLEVTRQKRLNQMLEELKRGMST